MSSRNAPPQGGVRDDTKNGLSTYQGAFGFRNPDYKFRSRTKKQENRFHLPEIRTQGGFQFRNPNPDFMGFLLYRFIGKSEKDLQNYSREQWSFLCKLCVCVRDHCVLEKRFSNPFADFPIKRKDTRKSRTDVSRLIRFYGSSRLCCNPKFRISQSNSRFANRAHPQ